VTDTNDGVFAFEHVMGHGADLLISDVGMPRLSGPESVARIFENSGSERMVPYVAFVTGGVSACSDKELLARLVEDPRVLGILPKPVTPDSVAALLRIVSVRKGLVGAGVLPKESAIDDAVESVRARTVQACTSWDIPFNPGLGSNFSRNCK
jgi:CheY-like chemotaxis protein